MNQKIKVKRSSRHRKLKTGWKIFFLALLLIVIATVTAVIFIRYFTEDVGVILKSAGISSANSASMPSQTISSNNSESISKIPESSTVESLPESQETPVSSTADSTVSDESSASTENPVSPVGDLDAVGDFSHALFIGDSRTQGFMLYSGLTEARYYTGVGLNVDTAFKKSVVTGETGAELTIPQALEAEAGRYHKVYLGFGINELGWVYSDVFVQKYQELIQLVKNYQPDATIYLQSIMPVTAERSASDTVFNNPHIAEYNALIQNLAKQTGSVYVDLTSAVADVNAVLPPEASSDGIHLNKEYVLKWLDYLRANT